MAVASPPARPWSTRRKLLLQLALLPLTLLGVELIYRLWLGAGGRAYDAATTLAEIESIDAQVRRPLGHWHGEGDPKHTARPISSPYYGWDWEQGVARTPSLVEYFGSQQAREVYDILVVGGSGAGIFEARGGARLVELLGRDPRLAGREVRMLRMGRGGYKQPQQLNLVAHLQSLGVTPDAVLNIDGFNEVAIGRQNANAGAHPLHPSIPHWGHLAVFGTADHAVLDGMLGLLDYRERVGRSAARTRALGLHRSAVLGALALRSVRRSRDRYYWANGAYTKAVVARGRELGLLGPPYERQLEPSIALMVRGWFEASLSLQAICAERGIYYLHVLQPTLLDQGSKPLSALELERGHADNSWTESVPLAYPQLREAGRELRARGVNFLDASMVFRDEPATTYEDSVHFDQLGNGLLAEHIAPAFLAGLPEALE